MIDKGKEVKQLVSRLSVANHNKLKTLMYKAQELRLKDHEDNRYILHTFGAELIMLGYEVKKKQIESLKKKS